MRRAILLLTMLSCHKASTEHEAEAVVVRCLRGEARDVSDATTLRGRVTTPPGGDVAVAPQVAGRLNSVNVREGQRVAAGDVLATVEGTAPRASLQQAEAGLAQVEANEANARATLDRVKALVARGIAAKQELDDAQTRASALKADADAARATVDLARRTLGRAEVRSSVAGVVTRVWRGPGTLVDGTPATPVVQIAATSVVEFAADATVRELATIDVGEGARTSLVTGAAFDGAVLARSTALDPVTGLGIVRVSVEQPSNVVIGTFGTTIVRGAPRNGVLTFPLAVLRGAIADGAEVVICKADKAEVRRVGVGWRDAERVELQDVTADEHVAVDHVLGLEDGQSIKEAQ